MRAIAVHHMRPRRRLARPACKRPAMNVPTMMRGINPSTNRIAIALTAEQITAAMFSAISSGRLDCTKREAGPGIALPAACVASGGLSAPWLAGLPEEWYVGIVFRAPERLDSLGAGRCR